MSRPRHHWRLFVTEEYQPWPTIPAWLWALMILALVAQISFHHWWLPPPQAKPIPLRPPPSLAALQILSLGDQTALARVLMLGLQARDHQQGRSIAWREVDYDVLGAWLDRIVALDERADYPHFAAAKIYSAVNDQTRQRKMVAWVRRQFARAPDHRWPWLGHMAHLARHVLNDDHLALAMAQEARQLTTPDNVPGWVRQMEVFFLAAQGEYESAVALMTGLLTAGEVTDPTEFEFLLHRLEDMVAKQIARGELPTPAAIEEKWQTIDQLHQMFLAQYGYQPDTTS